MTGRQFTRRHAAALFAGAFGVIIAVNVVLAVSAVRSFPGLEVSNAYLASQQFDARRAAQEALGWTVWADASGGRVVLAITDAGGAPVQAAALAATVGRATHGRDDVTPDFAFDGSAYVAPVTLGPGTWTIRMTARAADGTAFARRVILHVED